MSTCFAISNRFRQCFLPALVCTIALLVPSTLLADPATEALLKGAECEGDYAGHLQGVCVDDEGSIFWSFTTELVKTDAAGHISKKIPVASHHGDLCYSEGRIYVAVNLGKFNDPKGNADSWVYVYDAKSLDLIAKHETQEAFHGAGGIGVRDGRFYVVGGLPDGIQENYVYEYDADFNFQKKHVIDSKWTMLGIQTATFHDGFWWFGCYGKTTPLLKTDANFQMVGRYSYSCSLGIVGVAPDRFLIATGPRTAAGRHRGTLFLAKSDKEKGLVAVAKE